MNQRKRVCVRKGEKVAGVERRKGWWPKTFRIFALSAEMKVGHARRLCSSITFPPSSLVLRANQDETGSAGGRRQEVMRQDSC